MFGVVLVEESTHPIGHFSSITAFNRPIREQYVSEFTIWFFSEGTGKAEFFSHLTRNTVYLSSGADRHFLFTLHYCKQYIFHRLIISKTGSFSCVWAEQQKYKYGPLVFSLNRAAHKHHGDSRIKVFWNVLQHKTYVEYLFDTLYRTEWAWLFLINCSIWSSTMITALLERSRSSKSNGPLLNLTKHFRTMKPSP